jgi:hypothetical protein
MMTMEVVFDVLITAIFKPSQVNFPYATVIKKASTAPTPAASVGVATPAKMDPRTPKMRIIGGTMDLSTISASLLLETAARSSLERAGPSSGRHIHRRMI